jgi:hypothetical protein
VIPADKRNATCLSPLLLARMTSSISTVRRDDASSRRSPCGDQQIGEERVATAVAIKGADALVAVDVEPEKPDIAKTAVVFDGDERDVGALGGTLVGLITRHSDCAAMAEQQPPPDVAIGERALRDKALFECPSVELVERSNGAIPGGGRDTVTTSSAGAHDDWLVPHAWPATVSRRAPRRENAPRRVDRKHSSAGYAGNERR